jgi:hypothetical protein
MHAHESPRMQQGSAASTSSLLGFMGRASPTSVRTRCMRPQHPLSHSPDADADLLAGTAPAAAAAHDESAAERFALAVDA